ncbi:MAG: hypothetical protein JW822_08145 [Spirochaetales bacterium]|nr:hypothetical protein [Spirochaetales bacterium]
MSSKKDLSLYIGIRWQQAASRLIAEKTEILLEKLTLAKLEKSIPLHWNLPITPYLENKNQHMDRIITEIKTRITACKDCIVPMGYSGAPHPLLETSELEKELAWCFSNPWKQGIKDQFKQSPQIVMPHIPDIMRKSSLKAYHQNGFAFLGLPFTNSLNGSYRFGPWQTQAPLKIFYYQHITFHKNELKSTLPHNPDKHTSAVFILFDIHTAETDVVLEGIIQSLSKRFHIRFASLQDKPVTHTEKKADADFNYTPPLPCNPRARLYLKNASALKNKDPQKEIDIQNTLKLISFNNMDLISKKIERIQSSAKKSFLKPKIISAHMPGQVTLPGANFDVIFSGGRLHSIIKDGKHYTLTNTLDSFIKTKKRTYRYATGSVFSFEDESSRGLLEKTTCTLPGISEASSIIREYSYVGDFPYLLISMEVIYPEISKLSSSIQFAPFELALMKFKKGELPLIHSLYSDGTGYQIRLSDLTAVYNLAGSMFYLPLHDSYLILGFTPQKSPGVQSVQLRIEQKKQTCYLYVSFYGTYHPEEAIFYENTREVHSLFIGIKDQAPKKIPFFPQAVLKKLPAYNIVIQTGESAHQEKTV